MRKLRVKYSISVPRCRMIFHNVGHVDKKLHTNIIRYGTLFLAEAMRCLYIKGIIHRDLKPQNILLKFDPKFPTKDRDGNRVYPRPEEITLKIGNSLNL